MGINYKENNQWKEVKVKVGDNIPVGAEFDYDGQTVPVGYEEVDSPNDYSTQEQKIGTWIDGKPLYRIVVNETCGSNADTWKGVYTNADIDVPVSVKTNYYLLEGNYYNYYPVQTTAFNYYYNEETKTLYEKHNNSYWNSAPMILIIEYTKTTD